MLADAKVEVAAAIAALLEVGCAADASSWSRDPGQPHRPAATVLSSRQRSAPCRRTRAWPGPWRPRGRMECPCPSHRAILVLSICWQVFARSGNSFRPCVVAVVPILLPLRAALDGLAHVGLHFVGNQEMRIRRPAIGDLGKADLLFSQRFAVGLFGVLPMRRAAADVGINDDQRRAGWSPFARPGWSRQPCRDR